MRTRDNLRPGYRGELRCVAERARLLWSHICETRNGVRVSIRFQRCAGSHITPRRGSAGSGRQREVCRGDVFGNQKESQF
jgi:hypothetical protein